MFPRVNFPDCPGSLSAAAPEKAPQLNAHTPGFDRAIGMRLATYNVLAKSLTRSDWFPTVPKALLAWGNRWPRLVRESVSARRVARNTAARRVPPVLPCAHDSALWESPCDAAAWAGEKERHEHRCGLCLPCRWATSLANASEQCGRGLGCPPPRPPHAPMSDMTATALHALEQMAEMEAFKADVICMQVRLSGRPAAAG
jgi:hypothetical protein